MPGIESMLSVCKLSALSTIAPALRLSLPLAWGSPTKGHRNRVDTTVPGLRRRGPGRGPDTPCTRLPSCLLYGVSPLLSSLSPNAWTPSVSDGSLAPNLMFAFEGFIFFIFFDGGSFPVVLGMLPTVLRVLYHIMQAMKNGLPTYKAYAQPLGSALKGLCMKILRVCAA